MDKRKQLILALLVFVIALLGNRYYIDSQVAQAKEMKFINVVRAKKAIAAGSPLSAGSIESVSIPEIYAPKARIRWEENQNFLQQPLATAVVAGDYVLETAFSTRQAVGTTLSEQLDAEGYRALTITVDDTNSFSRSIVTGDRIDILFTFNAPPLRQKVTSLILQNVSVIATGSYSPAAQEGGDRRGGARYNTVTLKLRADDSLRLSYARQMGSIQLLLRSKQDNSSLDLQPVSSVIDVLPPADKARVAELARQAANDIRTTGERSEETIREQARVAIEAQKRQLNQLSSTNGGK